MDLSSKIIINIMRRSQVRISLDNSINIIWFFLLKFLFLFPFLANLIMLGNISDIWIFRFVVILMLNNTEHYLIQLCESNWKHHVQVMER